MRKYILFGVLSSLSILAHEFLPRSESPLFVVGVMWLAWFAGLFYIFEAAQASRLLDAKEQLKHIASQTPVIIISGYMLLMHIAMLMGPITEYLMAVWFLIVMALYEWKR